MRYRVLPVLLSVSMIFAVGVVSACCMVPKSFLGTISQNAQQAVLFHHVDREELILQIDYKIKSEKDTGDGQQMPKQFAWVVTMPNEPDQYKLADGGIYKQVRDWASPIVTPSRPSGGGCSFGCAADLKSKKDASIVLGRRAQVGPYDIQPVRAVGADALVALNSWLTENGFPTEEPKHMKYFVDGGFTFLCIKISPPAGKENVEAGGSVPPLHLSFKSEKPYYPLMFSSRQGVFDLNLFVLTDTPLDYTASSDALTRINWGDTGLLKNIKVNSDSFPTALAAVYKNKAGEAKSDAWYLNVIGSHRVNDENAIAGWTSDVFLDTGGKVAARESTTDVTLAAMFIGAAAWWTFRRRRKRVFRQVVAE